MDINKAKEIIRQIEAAYFEDEIGEFIIDEIISQIKSFIFQTWRQNVRRELNSKNF